MMILSLDDSDAQDVDRTGAKAARLAALAAQGFRVPDGFVVTCQVFDTPAARHREWTTPDDGAHEPLPHDVEWDLRRLVRPGGPYHGARLAVRSSAAAEDLADASFAGQYDTFLDVRGEDDLVDRVRRCFASAYAHRVTAYTASHHDAPAGMAVLVQRFIDADAAGVAFTAHPTTGERDVVVVSAVQGVGESLVSGQATPEEWEVRNQTALRRRSLEPVLEEDMALEVAALARRVEERAGCPQDIEWAYAGRDLVLLQARPMTALPDPVSWRAPLPGAWIRNFRLGEWLGDPVTPLFESWLIARVEARFAQTIERVFGLPVSEPQHVLVNGWYFYGLAVPSGLTMLKRLPIVLWRVATHFRRAMALTPPTAHIGYASECRRWRDQLLPEYEQTVAAATADIERADDLGLIRCIDRLADAVGDQFSSIIGVAGFAAKSEGPLLAFWKAHLSHIEGSWLHLVRSPNEAGVSNHAVQGLDWYLPTLGETGHRAVALDAATRERLAGESRAIEASARAALAPTPRLLHQFDRLVATAREAHLMRQRQTGAFTLAWPAMRRALDRLGAWLVASGRLSDAQDVYFLRRDELTGTNLPTHAALAERRRTWLGQRSLTPPLLLGELTSVWKQAFAQMDALVHGDAAPAPDEIRGYPGSPGRVTGRVRILRRLDELERLNVGEILVAPVTTPGWTPAFALARAVITDTGSIASHASIVAREYGIPAVVATGDATARLSDGQVVTVDGSRGVVFLGLP